MAVTIQVETLASSLLQAMPLFKEHWKEVSNPRYLSRYGLDVDFELYGKLEAEGRLLIVTARDATDKRIVGYVVTFIIPQHIHYTSAGKMAYIETYYVDPAYRCGVGARMFMLCENTLKDMGIVQMTTACRTGAKDNTDLLLALKWDFAEKIFHKWVGKETT